VFCCVDCLTLPVVSAVRTERLLPLWPLKMVTQAPSNGSSGHELTLIKQEYYCSSGFGIISDFKGPHGY
jgi:hypothetical protein